MKAKDEAGVAGESVSRMRVTRKLGAQTKGAIKLARQFGRALVCVRHRVDDAARIRFTTVEIVVDMAEIQARQDQVVLLKIRAGEYGLRTIVRTAGGTCDPKTGLWKLPKRVATVLRLTERIVKLK